MRQDIRDDALPRQEVPRKRSNWFPILVTGVIIGLVGGAPLGWFSHLVYYRYHAAQVLFCRQQHVGVTEAQLQATCGSL